RVFMFESQFEVLPEWVDGNKHMGDRYYVEVLMELGDRINEDLGFDEKDLHPKGYAMFTGDFHITFVKELRLGAAFSVETRVTGYDDKRFIMHHELVNAADELCVSASRLFLNIDWHSRKVTPFFEEARATLENLLNADAAIAPPRNHGRSVRLDAGRPDQ
ncbi:MAG: thioesterase family protein, partial [Pseudomonadota bacterium]